MVSRKILNDFKNFVGWSWKVGKEYILFVFISFDFSMPYFSHNTSHFRGLLGKYIFLVFVIGLVSFFLIIKGYRDKFGDYSFFLQVRCKVKGIWKRFWDIYVLLLFFLGVLLIYFFHFRYFFKGDFSEKSYLVLALLVIFSLIFILYFFDIEEAVYLGIISSHFSSDIKDIKHKVVISWVIIMFFYFFSLMPFLLMSVKGGYECTLRRDFNYFVLLAIIYSVVLNRKIRGIDVSCIEENRDIFLEKLEKMGEEKISFKEIFKSKKG